MHVREPITSAIPAFEHFGGEACAFVSDLNGEPVFLSALSAGRKIGLIRLGVFDHIESISLVRRRKSARYALTERLTGLGVDRPVSSRE